MTKVYSFRVGPYARSIYNYGTETFSVIPEWYRQPVKEYAASKFTQWEIDEALRKGYITQQEYDETILLIDEPVLLPDSNKELS